MSNFFKAHKNMSHTRKIAFAGLFLALVLVMQYLEHFMKTNIAFININLSLLFILPIFYFSGFWYGILALVLRFIVGPLMSTGYNKYTLTGHTILLICDSIIIIFMYFYSYLFAKMKKHELKVIIISLMTMFSGIFVIAFLNSVLFLPWYYKIFQLTNDFSISQTISVYEKLPAGNFFKIQYFEIPYYWVASYFVSLLGNLIKYSIIFVAYYPLSKLFVKLFTIERRYEDY